MKRLKIIFTVFAGALLLSCSSVKVVTDQDTTTDFSKYKTVSFLGWQDNSGVLLDEIDEERLRVAFKNEFAARNIKAQEEGGDMTISLFLVVDEQTDSSAYAKYWSNYGGRYGGRYDGGWGGSLDTTTYKENDYFVGTLVVDVFDEASDDQIWQAVAAKTITENPDKREKSIPKAVAALMKEFPLEPVE